MAEASDEHDECPECGREFQATDMTKGGDLVFVHDDRDMCSVETEVSGFDV